jgi:hypothetical protein
VTEPLPPPDSNCTKIDRTYTSKKGPLSSAL